MKLTVSPVWLHVIRVHVVVYMYEVYIGCTCIYMYIQIVHCTLYVDMTRTIGDRSGDGFDTSVNVRAQRTPDWIIRVG